MITVLHRKWNRAAMLSFACFVANHASAQFTAYWDANGATAGAGGTPTGTWGTDAFWSSDSTGAANTFPWVSGDIAVFSAGIDATNPFTLNVSGTQTASAVLIEEGTVIIGTGTISTGSGNFTIGTGGGSSARVNFPISTSFNAAGKVVLNGGALVNINSTSGQTFMSGSKAIEITANGGFIGYDDGTPGNLVSSLYAGTILGAGGTTTAPVGTLTKIGPDEFRAQNSGMANNTFAKLVVKEGLYRLGNVSGANFETAFGAVPPSVSADAITLDGGQIGTSVSIALHANRGITITSAGGIFNGAGVLTIPGPISGSGKLTVITGGGATLGNVGNVNTFTGAVQTDAGTLTLSESLNATNLTGAGGTVSIASGKIFTVGSDNSSTSYSGTIGGTGGIFTKVGTGTLNIQKDWTNTGATNITAGTLRFEVSAGGLGTSSPVNISAGASLDMNSINDTMGSIAGAGSIINGANLTIGGSTATATFSGTYSGTAASRVLTKNSSGIQAISGATDFTAVNMNAGELRINSNSALNGASGAPTINVSATAVANASQSSGATGIGVAGGTSVDVPNPIVLNGAANNLKIFATSGNTGRFNGVISGIGGFVRDDFGAGTVVLNGTNTFQGGVKIFSRTLSIGNKSGLGTGTLTIGDATIGPINTITITAATDLSGPNAVANPVVVNQNFATAGNNLEFTSPIDLGAASRTITTSNTAGKSTILSGNVIGVGGSLIKAGAGALTLVGLNNTYTGATDVSLGALFVNGALTATSGVTVTGTLGGDGSINPASNGNVTVLAGGKLSPGNSAGTLSVNLSGTGTLDLTAGISSNTGALIFEIGAPASDKVATAGGPLTIGSGVLEFDDFAFSPLAGFGQGSYLLFDGSVPISGSLGANVTGTIGSLDATISFADNNQDVVLTVVPEPGSATFLLAGLGAMLTRRRRRD
jgi:fibronectin-binding autotransporter adhesin